MAAATGHVPITRFKWRKTGIESRGPFHESPVTLRAIFGVTIPFVSQEQGEFKSSNFTVIFLFVTLKRC